MNLSRYTKPVKKYLYKNRKDIPISILLLSLTIITLYIVYSRAFVSAPIPAKNPSVLPLSGHKSEIQEFFETLEVVTNQKEVITLNGTIDTQTKKIPTFISIKGNTLHIKPSDLDTGHYTFTISCNEDGEKNVYHYDLNVILPQIDFKALKEDILDILGEEKDHYAIAVYDLKRKSGFDINGNVVMRPGSTSKLPYGIIVLRDVDAGKYSMDSVRPYLERMLQLSDNNAMMYLDNLLGGYTVHDKRVVEELKINNWFRYPHTCLANDIVKVYKGIYYQKYLSKPLNDYLINTLINAHPGFDNRIKQGIPQGIDVAHKTGYVWTDHGYAYNDTALVFGNKTDYIIVILDKDTTPDAAVAMMKPISTTVYETLDGGENPVVLGISSFRYYPY